MGALITLAILFVVALILYVIAIKPTSRRHALTQELKKYRYAHRGLFSPEKSIPENSLAAFRAAIDNGYGFELDVHLTADKRLAVIHDSGLRRTAGVDKDISRLTYDEVSHCRLEGTEEGIPLFEDVLVLNGGRVPMIIEVKTDAGNADEIVRVLLKSLEGYSGAYCVESFYPDVLMALKRCAPEVMRGQLSCDVRREDMSFSRIKNFVLKNLLTNFLTKPDFVAYAHEDRGCFSVSLCRRLYRPREFYWTVRDKDTLAICESLGAGIIFDGFDPNDAG